MGVLKTVAWVLLIIGVLVGVGLGLTRLPVGGGGESAAEAYFALQADFAPDSVRELGTLDPELRESSGLAVSRAHPGTLWSINDSGNAPIVYALDDAARITGRHGIGVPLRDWEALALGPCPAPEAAPDCLYIGDVGDNDRRHASLFIHVIPEPDPDVSSATDIRPRTLEYAYADGPDDVEGMAVSPEGRITLITKGRRGDHKVFHIEPEVVEAGLDGEPFAVMASDTLPFEPDLRIGRTVTGAAYSPTGARLVVRTYTELFFFEVDGAGELTLVTEPCVLGSTEPQGEAIAFLDERTVLTTSEYARGRAGKLLRIDCS